MKQDITPEDIDQQARKILEKVGTQIVDLMDEDDLSTKASATAAFCALETMNMLLVETLREHNIDEEAIHAMRAAARIYPIIRQVL